ncbi:MULTISPECIES: hypothetical protein [Nocardiaceae]|nr:MULTISPECIES: hypothetical protein [Rhodococcus]
MIFLAILTLVAMAASGPMAARAPRSLVRTREQQMVRAAPH